LSSDVGASNRQAAECLRTVAEFLTLVDGLKVEGQSIFEFGSQPPPSYTGALTRAKQILNDGATFLSDTTGRPHFGAPIITPSAEPILTYENDQLKRNSSQITEANSAISQGPPNEKPTRLQRVWKWISRGFKSADIIIGSLKPYVPGLSFVGEFKKQLENLLRKEP
jgi:hypothetical protein